MQKTAPDASICFYLLPDASICFQMRPFAAICLVGYSKDAVNEVFGDF